MIKLSENDKETIFKLAALTVIDRAKSLHREYYSSIKAVEIMERKIGISANEYRKWLDNELERANELWTKMFEEEWTKELNKRERDFDFKW